MWDPLVIDSAQKVAELLWQFRTIRYSVSLLVKGAAVVVFIEGRVPSGIERPKQYLDLFKREAQVLGDSDYL